jgi:hypothetical protein
LHLVAKRRIGFVAPDFLKRIRNQVAETSLILGGSVSGLSRITAGMNKSVVRYKIALPRKGALLNGQFFEKLDFDQNTKLAGAC